MYFSAPFDLFQLNFTLLELSLVNLTLFFLGIQLVSLSVLARATSAPEYATTQNE